MTRNTSFDIKMMVKIYAIEIIFKFHEPFQSYQLNGLAWLAFLAELAGPVSCKDSISMVYIFITIFMPKLESNLRNFFVFPATRNLHCSVCISYSILQFLKKPFSYLRYVFCLEILYIINSSLKLGPFEFLEASDCTI